LLRPIALDGKYTRSVKVNRPGVSVRTRSGYYAGETRVAGNKPSVIDGLRRLEGILPRTDVPLGERGAVAAAEV
jgi:hypothetical protein